MDLDGTILRINSFEESLLQLVWRVPRSIFSLARRAGNGQGAIWEMLATRDRLDVDLLPLNQRVVELVQSEKGRRKVILATAAHRSVAERVARRLGCFDLVIASDEKQFLKGPAKAAELVRRFGERGFDYIGDSRADYPVFAVANSGYFVTARKLPAALQKQGVEPILPDAPTGWKPALRALRPHQWAKNMLIFAPLVLSHQVHDGPKVLQACLAFIAFSALSSFGYLFNDLSDRQTDRAHPSKQKRPIASGGLSIRGALLLCVPCLLVPVGLALFLPAMFALSLAVYLVSTMLYTYWLKRLPVIDVLTLALLYTLRLLAGGGATEIYVSFWTLAVSLFLFNSLALLKRFTEMRSWPESGPETRAGRGYQQRDLPVVLGLGLGCAVASVLVIGLYIQSPEIARTYESPQLLWAACPAAMAWLFRLWLLANRGLVDEDPVLYSIRDRFSWSIAAITLVVLFVAGKAW